MPKKQPLTGCRFEKLIIEGPLTSEFVLTVDFWWCRCDCGKRKTFSRKDLVSGKVKSCGCFLSDADEYSRVRREWKKGPMYRTWVGLRAGTLNPDDANYSSMGGAGIRLANVWLNDYPAFEAYVHKTIGQRPGEHRLERVNLQYGYSPGNLVWLPTERTRIFIEWEGERFTRAEIADHLQVSVTTIVKWEKEGKLKVVGSRQMPKKENEDGT